MAWIIDKRREQWIKKDTAVVFLIMSGNIIPCLLWESEEAV